MRFINKHSNILIFILLFVTKARCQTISPYTLNMGGGANGSMEWSIGESASIANFTSLAYSLNMGVLQPTSNLITYINEYGPVVFGSQIEMGPNPAVKVLHIRANFVEVGDLSFQLFDSRSTNVLSYEAGTLFNNFEKDLYLDNISPGAYYMKVYFKPNKGSAKTGIYKIIKL